MYYISAPWTEFYLPKLVSIDDEYNKFITFTQIKYKLGEIIKNYHDVIKYIKALSIHHKVHQFHQFLDERKFLLTFKYPIMSAKIKAVVLHEKGGQQVVEEVDKPTPKPQPNASIPGELGDLLVKVKTVALNPVDW